MPESKYSTALSGLLNAAVRACSTWALSKPIAMIFWIAVSLTLPEAKVEASNCAGADSPPAGATGACSATGAVDVAVAVSLGLAGSADTGAFFGFEIMNIT
ncbi:hypothetical protein OGAPHI_006273 [Ogataea philodendri]|uniref:Uncharacterized protein n=1 Tax=Ogataea philodendri TaxID=1378263 RepID=A0A9P8NZ03_9ASCO|nr:uncharacterized protein OGAPHI_006273 [Ogataea philodendri]KAH3662092.1 hypothetical protein OGAPHI_006273 [Ogataea philodendri]